MTTPTEEYASANADLEANKAVVRAYYSASQAGDRSRFGALPAPRLLRDRTQLRPLGGRRHTAESFRDEVMPHLAKMLHLAHGLKTFAY